MDTAGALKFESPGFTKRLKGMLGVDFYRLFHTPMYYIFLAIAAIIPAMVLSMTGMPGPDGTVAVDMFTNTWQAIGSFSGGDMMAMDLTTMCYINMLYFFIAVLVSLFVSGDFKSGYAKTCLPSAQRKRTM